MKKILNWIKEFMLRQRIKVRLEYGGRVSNYRFNKYLGGE